MKYTTILILLFYCLNAHGQEYQINYVADIKTISGKLYSGATTLLFNDSSAVFIHNDWPKEDSFAEKDGRFSEVMPDTEYMKVYSDLSKGKLLQKVDYSTPTDWNFIFTEDLPKINWKIENHQKSLSGIVVLKAQAAYGGRDYTAWFAPSIPAPFGPYHFGGLPGAILEIVSADGLVKYTFDGFGEKAADSPYTISPPSDGKHTDTDRFEKWVIQRLLAAEAMSTETMTVTNGNPHPDYEIIKNRWTIILDYKRERGY